MPSLETGTFEKLSALLLQLVLATEATASDCGDLVDNNRALGRLKTSLLTLAEIMNEITPILTKAIRALDDVQARTPTRLRVPDRHDYRRHITPPS